jgi:TrmH family RNA methyltransferase
VRKSRRPSVSGQEPSRTAAVVGPGLRAVDGIKDPAVREAQALIRPEIRAEEGRFLIEGEDMVERALRESATLDAVFLADSPGHPLPDALIRRLAERGVPAYRLSQGLLFKILGSSYETSTAALAIARRLPCAEESLPPASEGRMLVAGERIQDPRNIGVIVRTADAVGAPALLLSADSADPTSRPAVRSSTGSILSLPVLGCPDLYATLQNLRRSGYKLVATSAAAPRTLWDADLTGPACFLMGNETEGLSPALRETADLYVTIPLLGGAHSLNVTVAAGIVLYEALRQRRSRPGG